MLYQCYDYDANLTRVIHWPCMVKSVEKAFVWPRVGRWMETFFSRTTGVYFTKERECPVEVGIPSYRASGEKWDTSECHTGAEQCLTFRLSKDSWRVSMPTDLKCLSIWYSSTGSKSNLLYIKKIISRQLSVRNDTYRCRACSGSKYTSFLQGAHRQP